MVDVLYYHYFLFYTKVFKEDQPHFTTWFALSSSEGLLINGIIDIVFLKFYCFSIGFWPMIFIFLLILCLNYWHYEKLGNGIEVVNREPLYFQSRYLSLAFAILFFLITVSWVFWGPIYGKYILENCS
jgi:hypothetical protein